QAFGDQLGMLHDVAGVRDHARDQNFAFRQLDPLPHVILVLVPRVCCFEAECAGVYPEHVRDDVLECSVMDAWALINSVTRMKADVFRGNAAKRSEEHTSELQSLAYLVCRLLLE